MRYVVQFGRFHFSTLTVDSSIAWNHIFSRECTYMSHKNVTYALRYEKQHQKKGEKKRQQILGLSFWINFQTKIINRTINNIESACVFVCVVWDVLFFPIFPCLLHLIFCVQPTEKMRKPVKSCSQWEKRNNNNNNNKNTREKEMKKKKTTKLYHDCSTNQQKSLCCSVVFQCSRKINDLYQNMLFTFQFARTCNKYFTNF